MSCENYKCVQKCMVVLAFLAFLLSLIFSFLNSSGNYPDIFFSTLGALDDKYYQEISPAPRTFSIIWPIIYIWNGIALLYIFVSIFLPKNKSPVNFEPTLIPCSLLASYVFGFGMTLAWLFAFDREILGLSLILLISSTISFYFAIVISCRAVCCNMQQLDTEENRVMLRLVRLFILNGLGLVATWVTIATCLNLADVIIYQDSHGLAAAIQRGIISIENGSSAILTVLFVLIVIWFFLDNFIFQSYTCCIFTVFPVLILGFSGLVAKLRDQNGSEQNLVFSSVILSFCVFAFVARILIFCYRSKASNNIVEDKKEIIIAEARV